MKIKKSSSQRELRGKFHGQTTVLALGMLLVAVVIVSFFFINELGKQAQATVKGIMTETGEQKNAGMGSSQMMVPPMRGDAKLTCMACAYITHSTTPNICLHTPSSTTEQPYAHCSETPVTGETCGACPALAVSPFPTNFPSISPLPAPPAGCYYKRGICPMIACQKGSFCPPCNPILVCPNGTPGATGCTTQKICPDMGKNFMCTFWKQCDACKEVTLCANPALPDNH